MKTWEVEFEYKIVGFGNFKDMFTVQAHSEDGAVDEARQELNHKVDVQINLSDSIMILSTSVEELIT